MLVRVTKTGKQGRFALPRTIREERVSQGETLLLFGTIDGKLAKIQAHNWSDGYFKGRAYFSNLMGYLSLEQQEQLLRDKYIQLNFDITSSNRVSPDIIRDIDLLVENARNEQRDKPVESPKEKPPYPPTDVKEFDDSFKKKRRKSATGAILHQPSEKQRKKAEFLEAALQEDCVVYAKSLGVIPQTWDNDGNPDKAFWLGKNLLGAVEFKSPKGTLTESQEECIKGLRVQHGDIDMFRVFRIFENFKRWLEHRIELVIV